MSCLPTFRLHRNHALRAATLLVVAIPCFGAAQAQSLRSESLPTSVMLGAERVRLPEGERMGLIGASLLFEVDNDWGLGPAVYGAASGRRGGFFVGGVEVQRRWAVGEGLTMAAGMFAGGGGEAAAPVGSGLMLRPALTLLKDIGRVLDITESRVSQILQHALVLLNHRLGRKLEGS